MFPSQVCDSSTQCQDGSDEWLHCHCYKMDMGHCEDTGDCVVRHRICDGVKDCEDGSDERYCSRRFSTTTSQYMESSTYDRISSVDSKPRYWSTNPNQIDVQSTLHGGSKTEEFKDATGQDSSTIFENQYTKVDSTNMYPSSFIETGKTFESNPADYSTPSYPDYPINFLTTYKPYFKGIKSMSLTKERDTDNVHYYSTNVARVPPPDVKVRVYPGQQALEEGQDAIIQCRDEGSTRSRVVWKREDNKPLPRRSKEVRRY